MSHDARFAAVMLMTAQAHLKRRDGQAFTIADFLPLVAYSRMNADVNLNGPVMSEAERQAKQIQNVHRLAAVTGMQGSQIEESEWQEILRKERERIAAIPPVPS